MNKLSNFVKNQRKDMACTQEEYAPMIGISVPTLVKIENGKKVGLATCKKLADIYKLPTKLIRRMMLNEDYEQE